MDPVSPKWTESTRCEFPAWARGLQIQTSFGSVKLLIKVEAHKTTLLMELNKAVLSIY